MSIFLYSCHPLECHCSSILEIFFVCNDIRCNKGESLVTFSAVVGNFAVVFDDYPVVASGGGGIISCCLFSFFSFKCCKHLIYIVVCFNSPVFRIYS